MGTGPASNNLRKVEWMNKNVKKIKLLFGKVILSVYYISQAIVHPNVTTIRRKIFFALDASAYFLFSRFRKTDV